MKIEDRVYGQFEFKEPVLLELLQTKALQRLKGIGQYGSCTIGNYPYPSLDRLEHSVGTMLLLKQLGADLEEQVAGLLHDVSHACFSHAIDYVYGRYANEDYHDDLLVNFLDNGELKEILEKYGYEPKRLALEENYKLLKRKIPFLCADRVDYALREFFLWANPEIVDDSLKDLVVIDKKIIFKKADIARQFAESFLRLQTEHWGGYNATSRYYRLAKLLKDALKRQVVEEKDFFIDDAYIINKIEQSKDRGLIKDLEILKGKIINEKLGRKVVKKFRHVDPEVLIDEKIIQLSEIDKHFAESLEKHRQINLEGIEI